MSRFRPEEYKPDGGFSLFGLPILLLVLCAAGAALGGLASFIGQWFYLIVLFPLGIGVGLIMVGLFVGRLTKMRSPGVAVLLGLVSSGVTLTAMHYVDYLRFLQERQEVLKVAPLFENLPEGPKDAETAEALKALKELRAVDSFASYMNMEATRGVTISRGKAGFNLGYIGTWIYWGVELAIVTVMAVLGLVAGAAAPFCSACNTWKDERKLGTLRRKGVNVASFLSEGEIEKLKEHEPAQVGGDLVVTAAICPNCKGQSPVAVKLEEVTKNAKGEEEKKELLHVTYPGEALAELEALFAHKTDWNIEA